MNKKSAVKEKKSIEKLEAILAKFPLASSESSFRYVCYADSIGNSSYRKSGDTPQKLAQIMKQDLYYAARNVKMSSLLTMDQRTSTVPQLQELTKDEYEQVRKEYKKR